MRSSLLTFATDFLDGGLDDVIDDIAGTGVDGVTLASVYHDARDVFPHNPNRVIYFHEPGVVFFQPTASRFDGLGIQPLVSRVIGSRDLLADVVNAANRRGVEANAWVVLLHCDRGRETEEFCVQNAFGDPYLTSYCPANPSARAYAAALVADVAARGVSTILMESYHYLPFPHGYHHERAFLEIDPTTAFLLSLCFCESCREAIGRDGADPELLRSEVAGAIREALSGGGRSSEAADADEIAGLFDGDLAAALSAREEIVSSLVDEVKGAAWQANPDVKLVPIEPTGAVKGYAGGTPTGPLAVDDAWRCGIDVDSLAETAPLVEIMAYASSVERIQRDAEAYLAAFQGRCELGAILRPFPPDCEELLNLTQKVELLAGLNAERLDFYHYGLATREALKWVCEALQRGQLNA